MYYMYDMLFWTDGTYAETKWITTVFSRHGYPPLATAELAFTNTTS